MNRTSNLQDDYPSCLPPKPPERITTPTSPPLISAPTTARTSYPTVLSDPPVAATPTRTHGSTKQDYPQYACISGCANRLFKNRFLWSNHEYEEHERTWRCKCKAWTSWRDYFQHCKRGETGCTLNKETLLAAREAAEVEAGVEEDGEKAGEDGTEDGEEETPGLRLPFEEGEDQDIPIPGIQPYRNLLPDYTPDRLFSPDELEVGLLKSLEWKPLVHSDATSESDSSIAPRKIAGRKTGRPKKSKLNTVSNASEKTDSDCGFVDGLAQRKTFDMSGESDMVEAEEESAPEEEVIFIPRGKRTGVLTRQAKRDAIAGASASLSPQIANKDPPTDESGRDDTINDSGALEHGPMNRKRRGGPIRVLQSDTEEAPSPRPKRGKRKTVQDSKSGNTETFEKKTAKPGPDTKKTPKTKESAVEQDVSNSMSKMDAQSKTISDSATTADVYPEVVPESVAADSKGNSKGYPNPAPASLTSEGDAITSDTSTTGKKGPRKLSLSEYSSKNSARRSSISNMSSDKIGPSSLSGAPSTLNPGSSSSLRFPLPPRVGSRPSTGAYTFTPETIPQGARLGLDPRLPSLPPAAPVAPVFSGEALSSEIDMQKAKQALIARKKAAEAELAEELRRIGGKCGR